MGRDQITQCRVGGGTPSAQCPFPPVSGREWDGEENEGEDGMGMRIRIGRDGIEDEMGKKTRTEMDWG